MGTVSTDVTTATPGSDGTSHPTSAVVLITCQRCGTVTPWSPYCPTDGAYLEIFGIPPWQPGGPPVQDVEPHDSGDVVIAAGAEVDMDGDGTPDDLPPIKVPPIHSRTRSSRLRGHPRRSMTPRSRRPPLSLLLFLLLSLLLPPQR